MKRIVLTAMVACLMALGSGTVGAAERKLMGNWQVEIATDPFDESKRVYGGIETANIALVVRCMNGINMYIVSQDDSHQFGDGKFGTRVGKNPPVFHSWIKTKSGHVAFHPDARKLIDEISKSESQTLAVRYELDESIVTDVFDTTGANELFPLVKTTCGISD